MSRARETEAWVGLRVGGIRSFGAGKGGGREEGGGREWVGVGGSGIEVGW